MKPIILIPTYNERETIGVLLEKLSTIQSQWNFSVLVIDDGSPDGTVDVVRSKEFPWVDVLQRREKGGLGPAYRAGFKEVLSRHPEVTHIVTMDADGSHRVEDLPAMLSAAQPGRSITLGTRWMKGGSVVNWPLKRQILSRAGTTYARLALRMNLKDLTGGFRIYSRELLESLNLDQMSASGYCYQIEMALAARAAGAITAEVPITFVERVNGVSKMSQEIVKEALRQTTIWGLTRALRPNADKLHYVK